MNRNRTASPTAFERFFRPLALLAIIALIGLIIYVQKTPETGSILDEYDASSVTLWVWQGKEGASGALDFFQGADAVSIAITDIGFISPGNTKVESTTLLSSRPGYARIVVANTGEPVNDWSMEIAGGAFTYESDTFERLSGTRSFILEFNPNVATTTQLTANLLVGQEVVDTSEIMFRVVD